MGFPRPPAVRYSMSLVSRTSIPYALSRTHTHFFSGKLHRSTLYRLSTPTSSRRSRDYALSYRRRRQGWQGYGFEFRRDGDVRPVAEDTFPNLGSRVGHYCPRCFNLGCLRADGTGWGRRASPRADFCEVDRQAETRVGIYHLMR